MKYFNIDDEFKLEKDDCLPKHNKFGEFRTYSHFKNSLNNYADILCVINGKKKLCTFLYPGLYGINSEILLNKLKILLLITNYYKLNIITIKSFSHSNDVQCLLFNNSEENILRAFLNLRITSLYTDWQYNKKKADGLWNVILLHCYLIGYNKDDVIGFFINFFFNTLD